MKKIIFTFSLFACACAYGHTEVRDTVYQYDTVTIYDTILIHDTLRIKRQPIQPVQPLAASFVLSTNKFLALNSLHTKVHPAAYDLTNHPATISEKSIILHEKQIKKEKDMKNISLVPVILAVQSFAGVSAQEPDTLKRFPVQYALVYPLTTHWTHSTDYRYNLAISPLYNKVGGINGIQVSGIGNTVRNVKGVQAAGIFNVGNNIKGVQGAGIANVAGNVTGAQGAGIANVAGNVKGVQAAGVINVADSVQGAQTAGIVNISNSVTGMSVAGVLNRTGTLHSGVQIGLVTITDSIENGVTIGLINIVKRGGYRAFSLSFADYMNVGAGFSMGHRKFFTTVYAGANFVEDKLWVAGIGIGTRKELSQRWDFQPEIVGYSYFPQDFRNIRNCNSTHLKASFIWKAGERFGVVLSPSIYHIQYENNNYKVSPISSIFSFSHSDWKNSFGFGLSVGLLLW
ncbi:MAG: hypothetical protein LBU62_05245 [Bacteroidales bacterium]|jgi:hypothetical protein|nr:hypothetical protein [Bacteroidales bacterium]